MDELGVVVNYHFRCVPRTVNFYCSCRVFLDLFQKTLFDFRFALVGKARDKLRGCISNNCNKIIK